MSWSLSSQKPPAPRRSGFYSFTLPFLSRTAHRAVRCGLYIQSCLMQTAVTRLPSVGGRLKAYCINASNDRRTGICLRPFEAVVGALFSAPPHGRATNAHDALPPLHSITCARAALAASRDPLPIRSRDQPIALS